MAELDSLWGYRFKKDGPVFVNMATCASAFFYPSWRRGAYMMEFESSKKNDVFIPDTKEHHSPDLFWYAWKRPGDDPASFDFYWEKFCVPLLPKEVLDVITVREPTEYEQKNNRLAVNNLWKVLEVNSKDITGESLYVVCSLLRWVREEPHIVKGLMAGDLAGLTFEQNWFIAASQQCTRLHSFLLSSIPYLNIEEAAKNFPLKQAIAKFVLNGSRMDDDGKTYSEECDRGIYEILVALNPGLLKKKKSIFEDGNSTNKSIYSELEQFFKVNVSSFLTL